MNTRHALWGTAALLVLAGNAWTQEIDDDTAESTIRLMSAAEADRPDAVTKEIKLPESLREDPLAYENAADGLSTASQNRARRAEGLSSAADARLRNAELRNEAMENRENSGRSEDLPIPPDLPEPPTPQGPPGGT